MISFEVGFSLNLTVLIKHFSMVKPIVIPASISNYESPITIKFVTASLLNLILPFSFKAKKASYFQRIILQGYSFSCSSLAEITGTFYIIIAFDKGNNFFADICTHPFFAFVIITGYPHSIDFFNNSAYI